MKPESDIRELFRKAAADTHPTMDQKVLEKVLAAHETTSLTGSIPSRSNVRSMIVKNPLTKLGIAVAVLVALLIGLSQLGGSPAGVAWGQVAERTKASQGVIYRNRLTQSNIGDSGADYAISYLSATRSRQDLYSGDEVTRSIYCDFDAGTVVWIDHEARKYMRRPMDDETRREQHGAWANPGQWVGEFLSRDYTNLGPKTIDGVPCEGIQITDPSFGAATFTVEQLVARVWVSVETGYPALLEGEMTGAGGLHLAGVLDQFQWDTVIDPGVFEPSIPPDYTEM
jgi:hypothetical protein